jgi:hypothetical protein
MPTLQWRFGSSLRDTTSSLPADNSTLTWWKLYGDTPASSISRYLSIKFTPTSSYSADKVFLIIRHRGVPSTLTVELCADNSGNPGTVLKTVTKNTTSLGLTDTIGVFFPFDWTGTEALTSGTSYHIKIYGHTSDNDTKYWQVLTKDSGPTTKYSADGSSWSAASVSMCFRVTDADIARQWRFFFHEGVLYAVSQMDDSGGSIVLMRNGETGTATAATATTLTCSALSMTTDEYAAATGRQAAFIRIYDGKGDGMIRQITSNTATQFTVPTWDTTPDTTSKFIVYGTDRWTVLTGHGLTLISSKPVSTGAVCYFPQGGTAIRRMRLNGNTYEYAADSTNTGHILKTHIEGVTLKVVQANIKIGAIRLAPSVAWGTDLTFSTAKTIGTSDYRITNLYSHNKVLFIFKEDGLYTYNNGIVERVGSNFADVPDRSTGLGVGSQDQYLWFGWAHSIVRMLGGSASDMMNFKRGAYGMPEDRTGYVADVVSAVGWLFFVIDGGTTNYSSIICWNGYGFHEIFRSWLPGVRIRNAIWQPCLDSRGRLWFDVAGDIAYIEFPQFAANPLQDTNNSPKGHGVNFHWEGACITSSYDAHDANLYKVLQTLRMFVEQGTAEVDYRLNADTAWTVLGTASTTPVSDLNLNIGDAFQVSFRVRPQVANTRTPSVLSGWQLTGRMMQQTAYQYLATFKTDSDQTTYTDEPDHDPNTLFSQLLSWATTQKKLTMRTQSDSSDEKAVTVSLPSKSVDWIDSQEDKWGGRVSIAILEV